MQTLYQHGKLFFVLRTKKHTNIVKRRQACLSHENTIMINRTKKKRKENTAFTAVDVINGKVSRDGILPELPSYRLPGKFSVRPALRTQGEKGNDYGPELNSLTKCL